MRRRLAFFFMLASLTLPACNGGKSIPDDASLQTAVDEPLYICPPAPSLPTASEHRLAIDPIIVHNCRLTVIEKQDVPSQREGVILFIGSEILSGRQPYLLDPFGLGSALIGAEVAAGERTGRTITVPIGGEQRKYRRLLEEDSVEAGQLLAQLDDSLARDDWNIKHGRVAASKADLSASEATRDEAKSRLDTLGKLRSERAASEEEYRGGNVNWLRYVFEADSRREAVKLAELERNQSQTVLHMHQIRSSIPGVVKNILKKRGEAVKTQEPLFQIHDLSRLRIEGEVAVEDLTLLRNRKLSIVVEPERPASPEQTLLGHLQEITGVAVSKDSLIVSASADRSVRVWDPAASRREKRVLWHPAPVKAVACTPPAAKENWCLTGAADGIARIWDLDSQADVPLRELSGQHHGAVTCVAFSPDGKWCATGGDDREIFLWNPATGAMLYRCPTEHGGAITSLQFTPQSQLVSAARDGAVRLWSLTNKEARLQTTVEQRSGEVLSPGISPDGKHLLLDKGKELRLLTLPDRLTEAILKNEAEASHFSTFALFSPDAKMIVTAGAADGRLQLWRSPTASTRPYVLRQLVSKERSAATCAAFAPSPKPGQPPSFLVTGAKDRQVLVWPLPPPREIEHQHTAQVTRIAGAVESSSSVVTFWAELPNPDGLFLAGTTLTVAIYPQ